MRAATTEEERRDDVVYVTKTVASIVRDDTGSLTAYEAAFLAIARDDDEGRYDFTIGGQQFIVTTERPDTHTR